MVKVEVKKHAHRTMYACGADIGITCHHPNQQYGCFPNFVDATFEFITPEEFCAFPLPEEDRGRCVYAARATVLRNQFYVLHGEEHKNLKNEMEQRFMLEDPVATVVYHSCEEAPL